MGSQKFNYMKYYRMASEEIMCQGWVGDIIKYTEVAQPGRAAE